MPKPLSWTVQMKVRDGQANNVRGLMEEMVASTEQEPGTHGYEWFLSADETTCHLLERYADSDAAMVHLGNFKAKFAERFLGCFEPSAVFVYGEPSDEARGALDEFGSVYLGSIGGFHR